MGLTALKGSHRELAVAFFVIPSHGVHFSGICRLEVESIKGLEGVSGTRRVYRNFLDVE